MTRVRHTTVNPEIFAERVAAALEAFALDDRYAVKMARKAVAIRRRRAYWALRSIGRGIREQAPDPLWRLLDAER